MVGSVSITSLSNRALAAIGGNSQIGSLNEDSPDARMCNLLFEPTFTQMARAAWWNCLEKQISLTLLKAAKGTPENPQGTTLPLPPQPFLYEYLVPPDGLHCRYLVPTCPNPATGNVPLTTATTYAAPVGNRSQIPFKVAYDTDANGNPLNVVLCNLSQAQLVYTVNQPNPSIWDSQFQAAFVAALAAFLAPALTMSASLMQGQAALAERAIGEARAADGNEGSHSQNREADWIQARTGGFGGANLLGNYGYPAYIPVAWPF